MYAASPYFRIKGNSDQLKNNSAVSDAGTIDKEIQCVLPPKCGYAADYHLFVWKNNKGGNVSTEQTSFIHANGDTLISTFWNGINNAGIYSCQITNSSDMTLMYEIHIGLYEGAYG